MLSRSTWRIAALGAALATAALLPGCIAVGPDFLTPAPPETARYTREPLRPYTSATDAPTGRPQRFAQGRDIPQEWWHLFRSPGLNNLIGRALRANPNLQATMSSLRAAKELVYAQQGK